MISFPSGECIGAGGIRGRIRPGIIANDRQSSALHNNVSRIKSRGERRLIPRSQSIDPLNRAGPVYASRWTIGDFRRSVFIRGAKRFHGYPRTCIRTYRRRPSNSSSPRVIDRRQTGERARRFSRGERRNICTGSAMK